VLTRLWESVQRKRPWLWPDKWILHHDNAPTNDALRVRKFLAKNSITKMDHPPYSPYLAPCDFWLFPKLKNALKGQRFADLPDIHCNMKTLLRCIPENDFQDCSRQSTIVPRNAQLHKESISKVTTAASAQVSKFYFHRSIPGIELLHFVSELHQRCPYVWHQFLHY